VASICADERAVSILHGTVDLLSEQQSIQPGHAILLGLHFRLEKGWHIYWVNPGDSGEPPRLEWRLPAGLRAGAIEWPTPSRLPIPPVISPDGVMIYDGAIDDKPTSDKADIPTYRNYVSLALSEAMAGKPVRTPTSRPYGCSVKYAH